MGGILTMDKEKILRKSFDWVINQFSNEKYNLVLLSPKLFLTSDKQLMKRKQFAHCTLQNRILAKLLIESGQFKKKDIRKKWVIFWGIHQYLIINVDGKKFKADPFFRILKIMK
jgi:hypothetical protein